MTIAGVDYGSHRIAYSAPRVNMFEELLLKGGDELDDLDAMSAYLFDQVRFTKASLVVVEAPIVGISRNLRTGIRLGMVAGALATSARQAGAQVVLAPPSSWKAATVGNGSASKLDVSQWLRRKYPDWWDACGSQDLVDATCLSLYGQAVLARSGSMP